MAGAHGTGRSGEAGLTTLEWLLVVAAVAGVAALAVVVVQGVVGDTAEEVESRDARRTAADLAVTDLAERWLAEIPTSQPHADEINRRYRHRCLQLGIIYSDISLTAEPHVGPPTPRAAAGDPSTSTSRRATSAESVQDAGGSGGGRCRRGQRWCRVELRRVPAARTALGRSSVPLEYGWGREVPWRRNRVRMQAHGSRDPLWTLVFSGLLAGCRRHLPAVSATSLERGMIEAVAKRSAELDDLCRSFHVRRLSLFGSAAAATYDADRSDLDFLVEFQPAAFGDYANTYFGLLEALERLFGVPVDLVVRSAIKNPYFLESVQQASTALYEA